jgi:prepilin-type N-terminal cleavage/methylation domain-containing protein
MKRDQKINILKRTRDRGMTMVEMMVALLISSLVIFGVVTIYRFANNNWNDGMRLERMQQQTQDTMGYLERDVKQAVLTTGSGSVLQPPMITTSNASGVPSYGVIIVENVGTYGLPVTSQVWYQLTTNINGMLRRGVASYGGTLISPTTWTTLLTGVTCTTFPFSVSTFDLTTDLTALTSDTCSNQSLTIATLNIQEPYKVPSVPTTYIVQPITTLTMRSNAQIQDYQLQGGQL